jgi:hypothetical protein
MKVVSIRGRMAQASAEGLEKLGRPHRAPSDRSVHDN